MLPDHFIYKVVWLLLACGSVLGVCISMLRLPLNVVRVKMADRIQCELISTYFVTDISSQNYVHTFWYSHKHCI